MKKIYSIRGFMMASVIALFAQGCGTDFEQAPAPEGPALGTVVAEHSDFDLLEASLKRAGLFNSLNTMNSGPTTVFGPHDNAWAVYYRATYSAFFGANTPTEQQVIDFINQLSTTSSPTLATYLATTIPILNYHMVSSKLTGEMITGNQVFATYQGSRLSISKNSGSVLLNADLIGNGATVTTLDITSSANGVVHAINRVMVAPASATVLTPLGVTVSYTTNPPTVVGPTAFDAGLGNADFELFAAMIRASGEAPLIVPNASPLPDFTIFQPTDAVMRPLLTSIHAALIDEPTAGAYINGLVTNPPTSSGPLTIAMIKEIVKYHYTAGRYVTTDFTNGQTLTMSDGRSLGVGITGTPPSLVYTLVDQNTGVADATITTQNILTNSGILHTVSGVLRHQ